MQINKIPQANTFKSKPIYPIYLRAVDNWGNTKKIPAYFSELRTFDSNDAKLVREIKEKWGAKEHNIAAQIAGNFNKASLGLLGDKFYITELAQNEKTSLEKIKSIMQLTSPTFPEKDMFAIEFLQSKSSIFKGNPTIKGAGALSVYGAVKLANENNFKNVYIHSAANDFYKKLGLEPTVELDAGEGFFLIPKKRFQNFLKGIEEKYFK